MESSTHIYLPKITCGNIAVKIIAFESLTFWWKQPMLFVLDENHVIIQLLFIVLSVVTPFVSGMIERDFVPPPPPHSLQTCAIAELSSSILTNEPQASGRASVWPLKYWTSAVSGRGQVERTSLLFTTKESQLSKGHIRSEFFHSASPKNNVPSLVEANFIVGPPEEGLNRWGVLKNIGNEKPRPLKTKEILSIIPLVLFNHSSFSVFLSLFLYFKYEKWQRRDVFSNSIEMAIFKIKIGLWKNTFFQFSEISGYVCPSILYAHDAIAKKNVSMNRRKKKFSFTQTNHKLFSPW